MKALQALLLIACLFVSAGASASEPNIQPFRLPTFKDTGFDFRKHIPPIKRLKPVNIDDLFKVVTNCYPEVSKFRDLKIKFQGGSRFHADDFDFDENGIGSHYIGIVAEFPLFDGNDSARERNWELQRRKNVALLLADLKKSIAEREHAIRALGLYQSLEARAKVRVQEGIASTDEQVGYLKNVIEFEEKKERAEAGINAARLALVAYCREDSQESVNAYLKRLVHRDTVQ